MAATTAWQHNAGDTKPVTVKRTTREEPGAHPEYAGAENWTGGATEERFDCHSNHGGASNVGGDAPVAAVDKRVNQPSTKHHDIKVKMKQGLARAKADRGALATAVRTPRQCCRPRGRKASNSVPR